MPLTDKKRKGSCSGGTKLFSISATGPKAIKFEDKFRNFVGGSGY